ncbi:M91 family zinc metallopeptidase [Myxococcus sp. SDU36]|uniref:M91 family zinc metallopeptidase n=1 Tax=Myxococcus sp. SDU36 TaxID=2831967 RepID=UPI0025433812|nr:M91 family zinc metallopeptidase [Myxococcus sp. SDU36]WIG94286.1 type III secretion system effector protein [Myxococcus sp. SDU36]
MKLRSKPSFSKPSSSSSRPRSNSAPPKLDASRPQKTDKTPKTETAAGPNAPRPTPSELQTGKDNLKRTDYGVVHPDLQGIRTRRDSGQSGADFADFNSDVRTSTHRLTSQPQGNQLMTELNGRTQAVNPGMTGTQRQPLTVADIYSGRNSAMPMSHVPRNDGTYASTRPAYRYEGQPGAGRPSDIRYNEQATGPRFNSLGHESVHAWRASNGVQVSPLAASKHSNADVFNQHPQYTRPMKETVEERLRLREEFETIGLRPTPHTPAGWAPSENAIRAEHGLPSRQDYSGMRPDKNGINDTLSVFDQGTDNRNFFQKLRGEPSPIGRIVGDLEK